MAKKSTKGKHSPELADFRRCEVCESPSKQTICRSCISAQKLPKSLQQVRRALFWRVRKAPARLTPGQVNYVMREHWTSLSPEQERQLDSDLVRFFGPTQTAYEALLHFGLRELDNRDRLSEFPENLRELRRVKVIKISRNEAKELDGIGDQVVKGSAESDIAKVQHERPTEEPSAPAMPSETPATGVDQTGNFDQGSTWLVRRLYALARWLSRMAKRRR